MCTPLRKYDYTVRLGQRTLSRHHRSDKFPWKLPAARAGEEEEEKWMRWGENYSTILSSFGGVDPMMSSLRWNSLLNLWILISNCFASCSDAISGLVQPELLLFSLFLLRENFWDFRIFCSLQPSSTRLHIHSPAELTETGAYLAPRTMALEKDNGMGRK